MSKFNGVEYDEPLTDIGIITICPYCYKKFLNKKSYRNHIIKGYCVMCNAKTEKNLAKETRIPLDLL